MVMARHLAAIDRHLSTGKDGFHGIAALLAEGLQQEGKQFPRLGNRVIRDAFGNGRGGFFTAAAVRLRPALLPLRVMLISLIYCTHAPESIFFLESIAEKVQKKYFLVVRKR